MAASFRPHGDVDIRLGILRYYNDGYTLPMKHGTRLIFLRARAEHFGGGKHKRIQRERILNLARINLQSGCIKMMCNRTYINPTKVRTLFHLSDVKATCCGLKNIAHITAISVVEC